jgi:hypothetical protein
MAQNARVIGLAMYDEQAAGVIEFPASLGKSLGAPGALRQLQGKYDSVVEDNVLYSKTGGAAIDFKQEDLGKVLIADNQIVGNGATTAIRAMNIKTANLVVEANAIEQTLNFVAFAGALGTDESDRAFFEFTDNYTTSPEVFGPGAATLTLPAGSEAVWTAGLAGNRFAGSSNTPVWDFVNNGAGAGGLLMVGITDNEGDISGTSVDALP